MKKILLKIFLIISIAILISGCERQTKGTETTQMEYTKQKITVDNNFKVETVTSDKNNIYLLGTEKMKKNISILNNDGSINKNMKLDNIISGDIADFYRGKNGYHILIKNNNEMEIFIIDNNGNKKKEIPLQTEKKETIPWTAVQQFDENGGVYAANSEELFYFTKDGILKSKIKLNGIGFQIDSILIKEESIFLTFFTANNEKLKIYEYKKTAIKNSKFGEQLEPQYYNTEIIPYGNIQLVESNDNSYDFYIMDIRNVYGYSLKTETVDEIFNWLSCDFNGMEIQQLLSKDSDAFFVISSENEQPEAFLLNKTANKENKETVVIATIAEESSLIESVLDFNRKSKNIKLIVNDYSQKEQPAEALNQDIITNHVPDIINFSNLNIENYAKKGILLELSEYLEQDKELSIDDFLPNILEACKIEGKLYFIPDFFSILFLAGNKQVIHERENWGMEEFYELYENLEKQETVIAYLGQEGVLEYLCRSMMNQFINWNNATINFNNDSFKMLLKCSKKSALTETDGFKIMEQTQAGTVLLTNVFMSYYKNYAFYNGVLDSMEVIGWPSETGTGISAIVDHDMLLAITANSPHKKAAYEFLRTFWTYQYQKDAILTKYKPFPTRKDVMEKKLEYDAAEKSYIDDGITIPASRGSENRNGITVNYRAMTKQQEKTIRKLINNVDHINFSVSREEDIIKIIEEEAKNYFSGDKTMEDVIALIENRVKLYVNEKS